MVSLEGPEIGRAQGGEEPRFEHLGGLLLFVFQGQGGGIGLARRCQSVQAGALGGAVVGLGSEGGLVVALLVVKGGELDLERPVLGLAGEGGGGHALGSAVAFEDVQGELLVAALGLVILLELGIGPEGREVRAHAAQEGGDGLGVEGVELSKDCYQGFHPPNFRLAVGLDEGVRKLFFEGGLELEGAHLRDQLRELAQVAFLLGAGQGNRFGAAVCPVIIIITGAVAARLVGVVIGGPDRDHFADEIFHLFRTDLRQRLQDGEGLSFLLHLEIETGHQGHAVEADRFVDVGKPLPAGVAL